MEELLSNYQVKVSPRARHVRLEVAVDKGLVVIIPRKFDRSQIKDILEEKRRWIERAFKNLEKTASRRAVPPVLPDSIALPLLEKRFDVRLSPAAMNRLRLKYSPGTLLFSGKVDEVQLAGTLLKKWLASVARTHLPALLAECSFQTGFGYKKCTIRNQKTRWGSCSSAGTISLNQNLLFFTPETARYVIIHELCHTRFMNHSPRFWFLVEKYVPDHRHHRKILRDYHSVLPWWSY